MECVKYRTELVDRARSIVGDYAEDVVSDLTEYFLRGRFNAPDDPLPLLMWYVKRRCVDHLRTHKKTVAISATLSHEDVETVADPRIEYVERALNELHPFVCRLVIMNYVENIDVPEISRRTGIKKGRIAYLIRQARLKIQENERT